MIKFFSQKFNKKGFTLAELLVVIAIIAVLVAIAIPIFTSSLNKAKEAVQDANARSLRAAASVKILSDESVVAAGAKGWLASAQIEEDGTIGTISITAAGEGAKEARPDNLAPNGEYAVIISETK